MCIEADVKLTFGSDAHHLREIGEFRPHLQLLREIGYNGSLDDIILDPRRGHQLIVHITEQFIVKLCILFKEFIEE